MKIGQIVLILIVIIFSFYGYYNNADPSWDVYFIGWGLLLINHISDYILEWLEEKRRKKG